MINSLLEKKNPHIQYKIIWRKQLAVPEKKAEEELTFAYKSIDKLITSKEKALYSIQIYVGKATAIISQITSTDVVLNNADITRTNDTI